MPRPRPLPVLLLLSISAPVAHAQWQQVGPTGAAYGVVAQGGTLYAGIQNGGVHRSTDHGDTWTAINTGITAPSNWWLAAVDDALFCGTQFGPAFRSTDGGASWEDIGLDAARGFVAHNDTLYACEWYLDRVLWSVDQGDTWNNTAAPYNANGLWPLHSAGGHLFVGAQIGGVYRITHSGDAWAVMNDGFPNNAVHSLGSLGDVLLAGTVYNGVYYSDDGGLHWTASDLDSTNIQALHAVDGLLFAGTAGNGVYLSTDTGATWTPFNNGLTSQQVARLTSDDTYLYAGTSGGGVFRYGRDQITGVEQGEPLAPLLGAFPNPCDDRLTLRLQLAGPAAVHLTLLDATGAVVAERREGRSITGTHTFHWDTHALAPGLYSCRVAADGAVGVVRVVVGR